MIVSIASCSMVTSCLGRTAAGCGSGGSDARQTLKKNSFLRMGWHFARRTRHWGREAGVPVLDVPFGERKHQIAEELLAARLQK
jgi:hypothetical protein